MVKENDMGIADAFNPEDRVEIKITDLYRFMEEAARGELIQDLAMSQGAYAGKVIHDLVTYRREHEEEDEL